MTDARAFVTDYRDRIAKLLPAIDLAKVAEAIRWFDEARSGGRSGSAPTRASSPSTTASANPART